MQLPKCSPAWEALALKAKESRVKLIWFFLIAFGSLLFAADENATVIATKAEFVYPDFTQCYEKNRASIVYFGKTRAVAVSEKYAIAYSKEKPTVPFIRHDALSHLYLFESTKPLIPVRLKSTLELKLGEWLASMSENSLYTGTASRIGKSGALSEFGAQGAEQSTIVGGLCCDMYGIGIGEKLFINSDFLTPFIEGKTAAYAFAKARFAQAADGTIVVTAVDGGKFKVGDKIGSINGKEIKTLEELHKVFSHAQASSNALVKFEREGKGMEENLYAKKAEPSKKIETKKAPASLVKKESYLDTKGLALNDDLRVLEPKRGTFAERSGLKAGDRLIQIDGMSVQTMAEVDAYMAKHKNKEASLLFERHQFQFFVTLDR